MQARGPIPEWSTRLLWRCAMPRSSDLIPRSLLFGNPQLVARNPDFPTALLIGLNRSDRRKHDVYHLDLTSGELRLVAENPGNIAGWVADAQLQVRAATAVTPEGATDLLVRATLDAAWE